jgi:serine/threonine protein kinase
MLLDTLKLKEKEKIKKQKEKEKIKKQKEKEKIKKQKEKEKEKIKKQKEKEKIKKQKEKETEKKLIGNKLKNGGNSNFLKKANGILSYGINKANQYLKNGTFIGRGSYACVVNPARVCTGNKVYIGQKNIEPPKDSVSVGKLFIDKTYGEAEFEKAKAIYAIDNNREYFITPYFSCDTDNSRSLKLTLKAGNEDSQHKNWCINNINRMETNNIYQIVMPHGGEFIGGIIHIFNLTTFIQKIGNIIEGINKLHKSKIAHCDIRNENIVYGNNTLRLIDFGEIRKYEKIYSYDNNEEYEEDPSPSLPYDMKLFEFLCYLQKKNNVKATIDGLKNIDRTHVQNIDFYNTIFEQKNLDEMIDYMNLKLNEDAIKVKIDVYMLGNVCKKYCDTSRANTNTTDVSLYKQYCDTSRANTNTTDVSLYNQFDSMIQKMTHIDPIERITIEQLNAEYQNLLNLINEKSTKSGFVL